MPLDITTSTIDPHDTQQSQPVLDNLHHHARNASNMRSSSTLETEQHLRNTHGKHIASSHASPAAAALAVSGHTSSSSVAALVEETCSDRKNEINMVEATKENDRGAVTDYQVNHDAQKAMVSTTMNDTTKQQMMKLIADHDGSMIAATSKRNRLYKIIQKITYCVPSLKDEQVCFSVCVSRYALSYQCLLKSVLIIDLSRQENGRCRGILYRSTDRDFDTNIHRSFLPS
jgi:hypothetical protein